MVCMSQTSFCTALGLKPAWRHTSVTWPYSPGMLYRMGKTKGSLSSACRSIPGSSAKGCVSGKATTSGSRETGLKSRALSSKGR